MAAWCLQAIPQKEERRSCCMLSAWAEPSRLVATGEPSQAPAPAWFPHALDFAFRANALPTQPKPLASDSSASTPASVFAGLSPGSIGLYQVNFVVPPVPAGLPPCDNPNTYYSVQSNLTVSIGGVTSFDGAGICVDTGAGTVNLESDR